jgi:hypothetical protein
MEILRRFDRAVDLNERIHVESLHWTNLHRKKIPIFSREVRRYSRGTFFPLFPPRAGFLIIFFLDDRYRD